MEDGAVVLHQAERRVRRMLHALCMNYNWDIPVPAKPDGVLVTGLAGVNLHPISSSLNSLLSSHQITIGGATSTINVHSATMQEEISPDTFSGFPLVMICDDLSAWKTDDIGRQRMRILCTAVKYAFKSGCRVCVGLIGEPASYRLQVNTLCKEYPEFRWLLCTRRMLNIYIKELKWNVSESVKEVLLNWISVTEELLAPDQLLDYADIGQIFARDVMRHLPDFDTFIRLFALSLAGLISVIITIILLILISGNPSTDHTVRDLRENLRHVITSQRRGKSEWTGGQDAIALLALQLNEPDWCLQDLQNQRSVDRMEINILASLARSRQPGYRELTLSRLSSYINALHVTYLNPRDFHGLNLVALLHRHVLTSAPYLKPSAFAYSQALIALCNSGVDVTMDHLTALLKMQRSDGGFGYSLDETALASIALFCSEENDIEVALNQSISYMASQRQLDGSYGSLYTTALVLQALNITGTELPQKDLEQSFSWIQQRIAHDPAAKNVDFAAQLLILFAGKTVVSAGKNSGISGLGRSFMKSLESTSNRVSTLHIHLSAENTQVVLAGDSTDKYCHCCQEIKDKCGEKNTKSDDVTEDSTETMETPETAETLEDVALKNEEVEEEQEQPTETSQTVTDDVTINPETPETVTVTPTETPPQDTRPVYTVDTQKLVEAIQRQRSKKKRKRKKGN